MRTTKPDMYSVYAKLALVLLRTKVITPKQFSARLSYIWAARHVRGAGDAMG